MTGNSFIPVLVLFPLAAALIGYVIGRKNETVRDYFTVICTFTELLMFTVCYGNAISGAVYTLELPGVCGLGLLFRIDGFRFQYAFLAMFMWAMATLFSRQYFAHYTNRNRYYFFWMVTLAATVGVFLSGDLITAFLFFEIMSFTSYVWVAQEETDGALRAAGTYLAVAVIGGLVMLMGIFLLKNMIGTLRIDELRSGCELWLQTIKQTGGSTARLYVAGGLILFGFGAKAGMFPLHIWLPKAHPVAPAPASALLSGMLTKVGIYGILIVCCRMFYGNTAFGGVILAFGVITMFLGALLALFSVDFKRTLACSSVSQIGFILVGIGMQQILGEENALAAGGTFLHMVNHSLFKLVLFLIAGVIVQNLHCLDLNDIRGFGRKKPFLKICYLSAALGIGGIPFFSGYISKTLLHEGIVEGIELFEKSAAVMGALRCAEIIFLLSGGITVAYMLKLFIAVFVEKNSTQEEKMRSSDSNYLNAAGRFAIGIPAVLIPIFGCIPHSTFDKMSELARRFMNGAPIEHEIHYLSFTNLKGALISIAAGILIYIFIVRRFLMKRTEQGKIYVNRWPSWLDLEDRIYRPLLLHVLPDFLGAICKFLSETLPETLYHAGMTVTALIVRIFDRSTDGILLGLRKSVYKELPTEHLYIGTRMTTHFGRIANFGVRMLNRTIWKNNQITTDYRLVFAELYELNKRRNRMLESTLSFGLLMFCVGLCATMIYLLFT